MRNNKHLPNLWREQGIEENHFKSLCKKAASCTQCIFKKLGICYISALFQE